MPAKNCTRGLINSPCKISKRWWTQRSSYSCLLLRYFYSVPKELFLIIIMFQVDELISNTLLNVDMEEKVYTSVINWVKHEPSERKKFVARVSHTCAWESLSWGTSMHTRIDLPLCFFLRPMHTGLSFEMMSKEKEKNWLSSIFRPVCGQAHYLGYDSQPSKKRKI